MQEVSYNETQAASTAGAGSHLQLRFSYYGHPADGARKAIDSASRQPSGSYSAVTRLPGLVIMRPSSLGGGRILRRTLSVCLSVCLSVRPVIVAIGNVFSSTASVTDVLPR